MNNSNEIKKPKESVGGQALIEGVMMRGPKGAAVSLRLPNGKIESSLKNVKMPKERFKPFGWPLIRGPVVFVDSILFGYKCLMESAEKTTLETEDDTESMSKLDKWLNDHFGPTMMTIIGIISAVLGFGIAFGLFFWLPSFLFDTINGAFSESITAFRTLFEGIIRIVLFVSYMYIVSQMKDMRRVFMYHGSEHKSIFCYENDEELTVENVRKQSRFHPRCGTSFIFVMILLSIIISSVVAFAFPILTEKRYIWMLVKLLIMPIIMSIGYEFIKYAGKKDNIFTRFFAAPGLWMQRITTKEPTDDIIEVGIASLKTALGIIEEPVEEDEKSDDSISQETDRNIEDLNLNGNI